MSKSPVKYYVVSSDHRPEVRVKSGPNRNARRLSKRLRNRFSEGAVMFRDAGRRRHYVPVSGEGFTVKREAERLARKTGGTMYRVATV